MMACSQLTLVMRPPRAGPVPALDPVSSVTLREPDEKGLIFPRQSGRGEGTGILALPASPHFLGRLQQLCHRQPRPPRVPSGQKAERKQGLRGSGETSPLPRSPTPGWSSWGPSWGLLPTHLCRAHRSNGVFWCSCFYNFFN